MKGCTDYPEEATHWTQTTERRPLLPRALLVVAFGLLVGLVFIIFWQKPADEGFAVEAAGEPAKTEAGSEDSAADTGEGSQAETEDDKSGASALSLTVYLTGAVVSPGVYVLETGARLNDAVAAAGGLAEGSASNYANLAALLEDGQHIHIPTVAEVESGEAARIAAAGASGMNAAAGTAGASNGSAGGSAAVAQKVNINTADNTQLESLPGIGTATAQRIIDYRTKNGVFKSVEDLKNVSGIGDKKYADLVDRICV